MDQHSIPWGSSLHSHEQGLQSQIGGLAALDRPVYNTPRIQINEDSRMGKALSCFDIGDVCAPEANAQPAQQGIINLLSKLKAG
jgi:hypothetical protein